MTKHIIPAEPGFIALRYWDWDYVQRLPVIAWIINPDLIGKCVPLPVTVDGVFSGKNCAVKQPNGDIICGGFGEWEDYEVVGQTYGKKYSPWTQDCARWDHSR